MARHTADVVRAIGKDRVHIQGSFRPDGSTGIVAGSKLGYGWSVARTSIGLYTITMEAEWPELITGYASVRDAGDGSSIGCTAQLGDYVAASKTIQVRVRKGAPMFIPLDLFSARQIVSNLIHEGVADETTGPQSGGVLVMTDSAPSLARVNGATDKAARLVWAANVVDEIQFAPVPLPPVCVASGNSITVHLLIGKGTNTDTTAVIDVQAWSGLGDTEMGGNTAALNATAITEYSVTLTGANVGAHPGFLNLGLIPGAHANDAEHLYAAWLEIETLVDLATDADNRVNFDLVMRNNGGNF